MSILFRWNPLTVSRPVYSSVLRSWFLVRHLLTLHANSLSRTSRLSVCFPDIHFLVRDQQSLTVLTVVFFFVRLKKNVTGKIETNDLALRSVEEIKVSGRGTGGGVQHFLLHIFPLEIRRQTS